MSLYVGVMTGDVFLCVCMCLYHTVRGGGYGVGGGMFADIDFALYHRLWGRNNRESVYVCVCVSVCVRQYQICVNLLQRTLCSIF